MIKALYANTWEGLTVMMIGYYHDHCHHYYVGACDDLPDKFKKFRKNNIKYVFIYEEDKILIKNINMNQNIEFNIEETRNLDECMDWVKNHISSNSPNGEDEFKEWISKSENEAMMIHHGYGTFIRNTFKLWSDGPAVTWFNEHGIYHADDMSGIIFTSLHRRENGLEIGLDEQIQKYRTHWEKYDPNVNKGIK